MHCLSVPSLKTKSVSRESLNWKPLCGGVSRNSRAGGSVSKGLFFLPSADLLAPDCILVLLGFGGVSEMFSKLEEPAVKPQFEPRALMAKWARDHGAGYLEQVRQAECQDEESFGTKAGLPAGPITPHS